jgi:hypothetical protein
VLQCTQTQCVVTALCTALASPSGTTVYHLIIATALCTALASPTGTTVYHLIVVTALCTALASPSGTTVYHLIVVTALCTVLASPTGITVYHLTSHRSVYCASRPNWRYSVSDLGVVALLYQTMHVINSHCKLTIDHLILYFVDKTRWLYAPNTFYVAMPEVSIGLAV